MKIQMYIFKLIFWFYMYSNMKNLCSLVNTLNSYLNTLELKGLKYMYLFKNITHCWKNKKTSR